MGKKQKRTAGDHLCGIYDNSAVIAVCIYRENLSDLKIILTYFAGMTALEH